MGLKLAPPKASQRAVKVKSSVARISRDTPSWAGGDRTSGGRKDMTLAVVGPRHEVHKTHRNVTTASPTTALTIPMLSFSLSLSLIHSTNEYNDWINRFGGKNIAPKSSTIVRESNLNHEIRPLNREIENGEASVLDFWEIKPS